MGFSPANPPGAAAPSCGTAAAKAANASRPFNPVMPAEPPNRPPAPRSGATSLRLGRASRLAHNRDFARVRRLGERLAQGCLIANWNRLPAGGAPKLGVVTSRKIGGAIVRSRARRLLRESFRRHQHELAQPVELVLVARHSIAGKKFAGVEKDFLAALNRAGLLK
jgi:ribonuclease P protein component